MRLKTISRLFIVFLLVSASLLFIAYSRSKDVAENKECTDGEKCGEKKTQTEFMLWESLSRGLFDSNN